MSESLTYKTLKTASQAKEAVVYFFLYFLLLFTFSFLNIPLFWTFRVKEDLKTETRKKNLIILMLHWMTEEG
jgi:hypothetical protein